MATLPESPLVAEPAAAAQQPTRRFQEKRALVLDAASALINEKGAAGMTLAAVAEAVGLNTASVTYYFKRRDDLALAAFHHALERIEAMVAAAAGEATPQARVRRYLAQHIELQRRVRAGEDRPITVLSDIRTMDDPVRVSLSQRYRVIMRQVRGFFGPDTNPATKALNVARAHVVLEHAYWLPVWLGQYASHDFPRLLDRMMEVLQFGVLPRGCVLPPLSLLDIAAGEEDGAAAQRAFLLAATGLINERGYRGASVERIASQLGVTKGSFYHHLVAKDDLVLACFRRSFDTVTRAQRLADDRGGSHLDRLAASIATLLHVQFFAGGPLLRTTALQALPTEFRKGVIDSSDRMARRFAGTIIDGISEGSIRAVDPLIAAQMLMPTLNSAYELGKWAGDRAAGDPVAVYASTFLSGIFDPD